MTAAEDRDDKEALAAEYVLGTLDPDERVQARALIADDRSFADLVRKWERRLGELNVLIAPVEPPPSTWDRIRAAIEANAPGPAARPTVVEPRLLPRDPRLEAEIVHLQHRMRRWRRMTVAVTALAAAFAGIVVVREVRPDLVPARLRPNVKVQIVEVPSPKPAQYVAILQRDAASPAFLLTFDLDRRQLTVRTVGAERQHGRSYELWLVSDKFPAPRSLGLIGNDEFTVRPQLAPYDAATINSATYAVSIEPVGGSPTGLPTGPVVYTGKLIQTTP